MRQGYQVAPEGLAAAAARLAREADALGRIRLDLLHVLDDAAELLSGLDSARPLAEVRSAGGAACTSVAGAVLRLSATLAGAARTYADVDALVTAAQRAPS